MSEKDTDTDVDKIVKDLHSGTVSPFPIMQDRKALLAQAPPDAERVRVRNSEGKEKWRKFKDLKASDTILLKKNGLPSFCAAPGRPPKGGKKKRKVRKKPPTPKIGDIQARVAARKAFVDDDDLVRVAKNNPDSLESMRYVMSAFAEEAAGANFRKLWAEQQGRSTTKEANQRVRYLRYYLESWLQHKELLIADKESNRGAIDMESPAFQALFVLIVETFREVLLNVDGLESRMVQYIITSFSKRVNSEEWLQKASKRIQESI